MLFGAVGGLALFLYGMIQMSDGLKKIAGPKLKSIFGTTITAQLAAFRTNLNARRAAWAHTMFNVLGAFIWFWFIMGTWANDNSGNYCDFAHCH